MNLIKTIVANKEWLFSGILVSIGGIVWKLLIKREVINNQSIKSGNNSINIQKVTKDN